MGLKDEQGMMAIGVALMLIVVLALFGGVLWQYSMAEMGRVERAEHDMQALFLARAGAEAVLGAWLEGSGNIKPTGTMDRIYCYYDPDTGVYSFVNDKPSDSFGYVDVTITEARDQGTDHYDLIEIAAVASVRGVTREAKLISYPRMSGHNLDWYDEFTGEIDLKKNGGNKPLEHSGFVVVQSDKPIHFQGVSSSNRDEPDIVTFKAPAIQFNAEINLGREDSDTTAYILSQPRYGCLEITSEIIYFSDLILFYLAQNSGYGERKYTVKLSLPKQGIGGKEPGVLGETIGAKGEKANDWYGKVVFQSAKTKIGNYKWTTKWAGIKGTIESSGAPTEIKAFTDDVSVTVAGGSFYFRNGLDLSNVQPYDLIPIESDDEESIVPGDIRAFYWE